MMNSPTLLVPTIDHDTRQKHVIELPIIDSGLNKVIILSEIIVRGTVIQSDLLHQLIDRDLIYVKLWYGLKSVAT